MEDRSSPTLVKALAGHKIVGVGCGSGDAHTIALEDNGKINRYFPRIIVHIYTHVVCSILLYVVCV